MEIYVCPSAGARGQSHQQHWGEGVVDTSSGTSQLTEPGGPDLLRWAGGGLRVPRLDRHQSAGQELLRGCRHPQMENIRKWTDLQRLDKVKSFLYDLKMASSHSTCSRWEVPTPAQLRAPNTQETSAWPSPCPCATTVGSLRAAKPPKLCALGWGSPGSSAPAQRCPSSPGPGPTRPPHHFLACWAPPAALGLLYPHTFGAF